MLGMGAGGLDVAVAMGGGTYYITMPKMIRVNLLGKLSDYVGAKDVILEVLRILGVKGGVGAIVEYGGEGVKTLSVPQRATITNMGAELGATSSIFPSDEVTKAFLKAEGREEDFVEELFIASTHATVLFFTTKGRVFKIKGYEVPEASRQAKGLNIVNLLQLDQGEEVSAMIPLYGEIDEDNTQLVTEQAA